MSRRMGLARSLGPVSMWAMAVSASSPLTVLAGGIPTTYAATGVAGVASGAETMPSPDEGVNTSALGRGIKAVEKADLAHFPEKWKPIFPKGHAPIKQSRAHPDATRSECALENESLHCCKAR